VFKEPSPGAGGTQGYLALALPAEHEGGNKKVPPRTLLCAFLAGRVSATATTGVEWVFTKPKNHDVYDFTGNTCKTLADFIVSTKATSVARHSPTAFAAGSAPVTVTPPAAPPRYAPADESVNTFLEFAKGLAEVTVGWVVKAKGTDIVPVGIGIWTKKQIIFKMAGGGLHSKWLLRLCFPVLGPASSYL
jgi:hypothetical protein